MNRSTINLYQGDCMEAMSKMPDNAYDLAIVDPPYGIGEDGGKCRTRGRNGYSKYDKKGWDKTAPNTEYFTELKRVSKNQIIWGANHFVQNIPNASSSCWVIWDKMNGESDFADGELAYTSFKTASRFFRRPMQATNSEGRIHPTQKPVKLYEWLLINYAKEGDKILDTHGGSMSIVLACHNLKFDLDLWELDEDYYKAGVERFENHKRQLQLF